MTSGNRIEMALVTLLTFAGTWIGSMTLLILLYLSVAFNAIEHGILLVHLWGLGGTVQCWFHPGFELSCHLALYHTSCRSWEGYGNHDYVPGGSFGIYEGFQIEI